MAEKNFPYFHPLVRTWLEETFPAATDIQKRAWPVIAGGRHVLITAPTGSGKTLTAFLWPINQLISGVFPPGTVRVLYVSPLKALNTDIRRNLLAPLAGLKKAFGEAGEPFPEINVLTRSGDTPGEERRRMIRNPPEILITTPESLNLLLTSRSGRSMLTGIAVVILDEIHAIVGSKRGTHLITAVDRLVLLSGEFQRIALSATVNPIADVAAFVGGFRPQGGSNEPRPIEIIRSDQAKSRDVRVAFPADARAKMVDKSLWPPLIDSFKAIIRQHRSTLFFTNSRRHAEKVAGLINQGEREQLAYAHHGSLAREVRLAVEQKLKKGELKAIVATNSLELGIDIGDLDQVVLVQTPRSVSSALQRIGRSGHAVGETSRGLIYPVHGRDFADAAVMVRAVREQDIEAVRPIDAPLDVLAQVILSMTAHGGWDIDELFAFIRTSYPYRSLPRRQFDLVIEMLAGRYADSKLRELKARVSLDRIDNTIEAHTGVPYLLSLSGGTIPERGYFTLRVKDSRARIGELDEEFVWERSIGETFSLGTQLWRIENITHNDVEVVPARSAAGIIPFWKAEELNRDFHLSERIGLFLEYADRFLDTDRFRDELRTAYGMADPAAEELISFLKLQKDATGRSLPHRHHLLVEYIEEPANRGEAKQVVLHTFWGGRVNRPFSLALAAAWEERYRTQIRIIEGDDAVLLMLARDADAHDLIDLVTPENAESLLRKNLEHSGFFGARFRENAERALLLPKAGFRQRMPLWLIRQRAKELLEAVRNYQDFPVVIETWRTCLRDEFDLEHLKLVLEDLRTGAISISSTVTRAASPFAGSIVWKQTNALMYEDDTPTMAGPTGIRSDLIREMLFSSALRPRIPREVIRDLDARLKRTVPGYAPASPRELLDWIKERLLIPEPEWRELAAAIRRDYDADAGEWLKSDAKKLAWLSWPGLEHPLLAALETVPRALVAFRMLIDDITVRPVSGEETPDGLKRRVRSLLHGPSGAVPAEYDLPALLAAWLACYAVLEQDFLPHLLGITAERVAEAILPLVEAQELVADRFSEESRTIELSDSANLEMLLRMTRRFRRPSFEALPLERLPLFLAAYQGIVPRGQSQDDLPKRLEQLFGWPAPVGAWEEYILPARMQPYQNAWIDDLMHSSELVWFGCGQRRISIAFKSDLDLFRVTHDQASEQTDGELARLIPDRRGRYSFLEIAEFAGMDSVRAAELLWKEAWRGLVTSDTFQTVRKGAMTGFKPVPAAADARPASRRSGFNRWKVSRPLEGHWLRIDTPSGELELVEREELARDRVRQLLRRYGLLFRELIANELPSLAWPAVFRALRLMELSGEILSGYFFQDIPGPQFMSHEAFRMLQEPLAEDAVYWINAADPASLCGSGLSALAGLPARIGSTYLVYHGIRLVLVARRGGRSLDISALPDDPQLAVYFNLFRDLLYRDFNPPSKITIETINGEHASRSIYAGALKQFGFRSARNTLELWKEY